MERRRKWEGLAERTVVTTCPYCGVGCQLELEVKGKRVIGVTPSSDGVNQGQACVRGRFGIVEIVHHPRRLKMPMVRRDGQLVEATWDEALDAAAGGLARYSGEEVAVICCAECTNEENYLLQKLARVVLGTNNIDHYARLCQAPTIAGLSHSLGNGVMTNSIAEIKNTSCVLAIGIDPGSSQPVVGVEVKRAVNNDGAKLIVANPYPIGLCRDADLWLPYRPGTEAVLLGGIMKAIIDEWLVDISFIRERCDGFDSLMESLASLDLDSVAEVTGVSPSRVREAARLYATTKPACILYGEGLTQQYHGSDNVLAVANLALLTGNIGRSSAGVNPVVGLNNVQGACDMGVMPDFYPGYQPAAEAANKQRFEATWGSALNSVPGLTLTEILHEIGQGRIKAAYVIGDDPVLRGKLDGLEFLVVQGMFPSSVSQTADVVLPAASFVEKEGTFTNAERRIQLVRQAIPLIGSSQPDWWIICQLARRLGSKGFDFNEPADIMAEIGDTVPIYQGVSYRRLEKGSLQWPCAASQRDGTPILYRETFNGGRARFTALQYNPSPRATDADYPLLLTTEPSLYYFHAGAMDVGLGEFSILDGGARVVVNPDDAARLEVNNGEAVRVVSRQGEVVAEVEVNRLLPAGVVSMPLHFAHGIVNSAIDPVSKIPEYKVCAVRLERNR
jgi:formate dehydrogenase alpha subunit